MQSQMTEQQICPSVTGEAPDAQIIGFIGADGVVANIPTQIPLTDEMRASIGPQPERIFRLAAPCTQSKCVNWENQACALIGRMRQQVDQLKRAPAPVADSRAARSAPLASGGDRPGRRRVGFVRT